MRTVRCSGHLSCHTWPPQPSTPPAMHTPTAHAPCQAHTPTTHAPCHVCPLPRMPPPCHTCSPCHECPSVADGTNGFKTTMDPFLACMRWIPQIHHWCDPCTCTHMYKDSWDSNPGLNSTLTTITLCSDSSTRPGTPSTWVPKHAFIHGWGIWESNTFVNIN